MPANPVVTGGSASRRVSELASDGNDESNAPLVLVSDRLLVLVSWCNLVQLCRRVQVANPPPPLASPAKSQEQKSVGHVRDPVLGRRRCATGATGSHLIFEDVQSHRVLALVLAAPWDAFGCMEARCCSPCQEHWCSPNPPPPR